MSDRALTLAVTAALLFGAAPAVHAQSDANLEAKRRAAIVAYDELTRVRARRSADSVRRIELPRVRDYSGLIVFADTSAIDGGFLAAMDSAHAQVHREARELLGASADTLLSGQTLSLTRTGTGWRPIMRGRDGRPIMREHGVALHTAGRLGSGAAVESGTRPQHENLERHFVGWFSIAAGASMSPAMRQWTRPVIPLRSTDARTNPETYWLMASLEYTYEELTVGRSCLNGSVSACRSALALVIDGDTLGAWMDGPTRRRIASFTATQRTDVDLRALRTRCVRGDDLSCRVVLLHRRRQSPTPAEARMAFIRQAIVRGGPGAYDRLIASRTDTIARALEVAAQVPVDTLVSAWRADVVAAQPKSPAPSGVELLVAVASSLLVVGIATGRRP